MILAVDLASRFSACCLMDSGGEVSYQTHSWQKTEREWVDSLSALSLSADIVLVEDLPFRIGQTKTVRDVYRLQGRIIDQLERVHTVDKLVWIPPQVWETYWKDPAIWPGKKKVAKQIAHDSYGYDPPELLHRELHGKDRPNARKTMEDYVDAFMIARYMLEQSQLHGSVDKAVENHSRLERYVGR